MANENPEQGLSSKLSQVCELRDLYINLNGSELCTIDVTNYECLYGGCKIPAKIEFIDSKGHTTGDKNEVSNIGVGGFLDVGFTTSDGCEHKESFVITKVNTRNNEHNQKLVSLTLEDVETRNMKGAYKAKGYPGEKFSEAVNKHFKEIGNDALNAGKELITAVPQVAKEMALNMVVPGHMDFYSFLNTEMKDRGFNYIKDRAMNYLVHFEHREFNNLLHTQNIFEYDAINSYDFNRILQFHMEGFDMEAYLCSLSTSNTSISEVEANSPDAVKNASGIDSKISKKDLKDSKAEIEVSGVKNSELVLGKGQKQGHLAGKDQQYFEAISNAQRCSMWVPGRVDNLVGKKVTVVFPKPTYYAKESDRIFTGDWEVYLVRDKIIGGYFVNELFLRRPTGKTQ
jgi:hypothetical protein